VSDLRARRTGQGVGNNPPLTISGLAPVDERTGPARAPCQESNWAAVFDDGRGRRDQAATSATVRNDSGGPVRRWANSSTRS